MQVFITGGTGQTGPAVVTELIGSGHRVTGLARSDEAAERLEGLGASALRGSIEDLEVLTTGAKTADGVIHMAFGSGDYSDPQALTRRDVAAIEALGGPLIDTGAPLIVTSGTLAVPAGRVATEEDAASLEAVAALRHDGEEACLALSDRGVRSIVMRPAPTVHGPRDHGFVPMLIATARRTGISAFVGDGANRWPAVQRLDLADLYRLALEKAAPGTRLHGVGESAIAFRSIAEKIGERLGVPTRSLDADEAAEHFGSAFMAVIFGADAPASSELTRRSLGWAPDHWTLTQDLDDGDYFDAR